MAEGRLPGSELCSSRDSIHARSKVVRSDARFLRAMASGSQALHGSTYPEYSRRRNDAHSGPRALCLQCHCLLSACRSLALGQQYTSLGSQPLLCGSIPGLVPKQLRFCRNYIEIMPSVAEGVKLGIQECQHQFRGRRWNCTTIDDSLAIFGPVLDKGTVSGWVGGVRGGGGRASGHSHSSTSGRLSSEPRVTRGGR